MLRRWLPARELSIEELNEDEQAIVEVVGDFVDREVRPVVRELEHANTYPGQLIEQMKELGIFGLAIPEPYGDVAVSHALLRARHRGAGPRLDEPGRGDGRPHGGVQAAGRVRHRRAEGRGTCRGWPPARCAPRWR